MNRQINWVNTCFLLGSPVISILGITYLFLTGQIYWPTLLLGAVLLVLTGLSITAGYHRLFSHKSFGSSHLIRLLFLIFGAASFQNSALKWSSDHRRHHKFTDTDRDPYNIKQGFWYAHWGWIFFESKPVPFEADVPDLCGDPLLRFQHKYYPLLGILAGFGLPVALASLWGDALGGLIIAGFTRIVLNHHFTFAINSFAHQFGRQPFSDKDSSKDNWILSLFTYGEGYHNFHHRFPWDYRNGIRWFDWDPSKWVILTLAWVRQARELRRASDIVVLRARLQLQEKRLLALVEKKRIQYIPEIKNILSAARIQYERAYHHFQNLNREWKRVRKENSAKKAEDLEREFIKARHWLTEANANWEKWSHTLWSQSASDSMV